MLSLVFLTYILGGCVMKVNDYSNNLYEAIKEHDADRFHELLKKGGEADVWKKRRSYSCEKVASLFGFYLQ